MGKTVCAVILILYGVVMLMMCYIVIFKTGKELKNRVHFYVARDKNGKLWLYMGKPVRYNDAFIADLSKGNSLTHINFRCFGIDEKDYVNLKWEDEPVEVFLNMEEKL